MARAVGLEITDSSVRILWVEHAGKKTRFLSFYEAPIPPGTETPWEVRATEALRAAFSQSKIPRSRVVSALDSGDAILREVSLPFKGDDQIRRTVRFEMESLIHNYTIEQLVVSHYKTGETDKGSLLLAAAVPKTVIESRLKLMWGAGVDPTALDLDVGAIFNAALHAGAIDSDAPQLLIYGTPKFTKLVFIEARQPRSIRTIRFSLPAPGSEDPPSSESEILPDQEPSTTLPPADTAIVLLSQEDAVHFQELGSETQSSLVSILAKEISRFLLANAASAQPAHILLTGEFEDFQAAKMLESATQIPVRTFNLVEALDPKSDPALLEKSSRLGVPLGLALKGVGIDALGLDFRQDEFQYRRKFEALKTTALVTMELVIVFLAAIALHLYFKKKDVARDTATMLKHQLTLYENVSPETLADPVMAYPKMKELYEQSRLMGGAELPIKLSAREAWRDLFNALESYFRKYGRQSLGDGEFYLEIEGLDISQNPGSSGETFLMTFRGKVRNLQFAEALKGEVRQVEQYRNADWVGGITPTSDGMVQFTLRATKGGKT